MNEELKSQLKYLRLNGLLAQWEDYLKLAADQRFSHHRLLAHVIGQEYRLKQERARQLRLTKAHIPELWRMETYPFERQPKLNKKKVLALYDSLGFMRENQNIIWLGGTGCGKTGLATSFLIHAIDQGYSGRFIAFPELVEQLYRSIADHSQARALKKFLAYDALVIDEIGYIEVEPAQVGQFFTLMQRRHKKKPTLITSNLGFSEWGSFLKNDHLTAALVDRLTENSHLFNMKGCRSLRRPMNPEP
jgi:DNA replication protein DnaC